MAVVASESAIWIQMLSNGRAGNDGTLMSVLLFFFLVWWGVGWKWFVAQI